MKSSAGAFDLLQDVGSSGCPDRGLWVVDRMIDVVEDRRNQILDTAKYSPAQAILCRIAEEGLDHVQP